LRVFPRTLEQTAMDAHLDEEALAKRWSMSSRTLQRWRQNDQGPLFLKLGDRVVYRLIEVETYERERLCAGTKGKKRSGALQHDR
jgi:hypothetical protein